MSVGLKMYHNKKIAFVNRYDDSWQFSTGILQVILGINSTAFASLTAIAFRKTIITAAEISVSRFS